MRDKQPPRKLALNESTTQGFERLAVHPSRFEWPPHLAKLLGKMSDEALALRAGVSITAVAEERRRRRIRACFFHQPIAWTDEMIALLGTDVDGAVADELGLSARSVTWKRSRLGIPPYAECTHRRPRRSWQAWEIAKLGTQSDRALARLLGRDHMSVRDKRHELGIAPFMPAPRRVDWSEELIAQLGTTPDRELAERLGTCTATIKRKRDELQIPPWSTKQRVVARDPHLANVLSRPTAEVMEIGKLDDEKTVYKLRKEYGIASPGRATKWTPEWIAKLGVWSDREIAEASGMSRSAVAAKRNLLGILPVPVQHPLAWSEEDLALLAHLPDAEVARRTQRSVNAVNLKRSQLRRSRAK